MKENAISKVNQMGRIGNILTTIAKIFVILGLTITVAGTIMFALIPEDLITAQVDGNILLDINLAAVTSPVSDEEVAKAQQDIEKAFKDNDIIINGSKYGVNSVNLSNTGISLELTDNVIDFSFHNIVWAMLAALLYFIMTLVTLFFIGSLCKTFQNCSSPFEAEVIRKMKMLAYSLIPWTILTTVKDAIAQNLFTNSFELNNIGINLNMVLTVLIILALAYIFQYGAVLQQESDETL
ncbi:MAG: DUF2975 domain-containing protein [Lachnospiraceae bacterium]|nr:DUF2975 domain-containing protein [Lachnospiraceae bacterium]